MVFHEKGLLTKLRPDILKWILLRGFGHFPITSGLYVLGLARVEPGRVNFSLAGI